MNKKRLYFVAVVPPEEIRDQVTKVKLEFAEKFVSSHALKSPPHITLIPPFMAASELEQKTICLLEEVVKDRKPFEVRLNGFGAFKPRVIFIAIQENEALQVLEKELTHRFKQLPELETRKGKSFNPHMSVAFRDLSPPMFHKAWDQYRSTSFEAVFDVKSIFLLKHNGKFWDIHSEIFFTPTSSPS